jgi:hypothetical protein
MNTEVQTKCPVGRVQQFFHKHTLRFRRTRKTDEKAMKRWVRGHHLFFVLIVGANIALRRALGAIQLDDLHAAEHFLGQAANLMRASAAAMHLAANLNRASFEYAVVPAMQAYHPQFTGMDSGDHQELVRAYKMLDELLKKLPPSLHGSANAFRAAVDLAMNAHVFVCARHGGAKRASTSGGVPDGLGTKAEEHSGLEKLFMLLSRRLSWITPKRPNTTRVHA